MERKLLYDVAVCVCCILYVKSCIKVLTVYWNKQIKKKDLISGSKSKQIPLNPQLKDKVAEVQNISSA